MTDPKPPDKEKTKDEIREELWEEVERRVALYLDGEDPFSDSDRAYVMRLEVWEEVVAEWKAEGKIK